MNRYGKVNNIKHRLTRSKKGRKKIHPFNGNAEAFPPPFNYIHRTRSVARISPTDSCLEILEPTYIFNFFKLFTL